MIKLRYVAQIEVEDEVEQTDDVLPIEEIKEHIREGVVEDSLKGLVAKGFCKPKIIITQLLADAIEVEGEQP